MRQQPRADTTTTTSRKAEGHFSRGWKKARQRGGECPNLSFPGDSGCHDRGVSGMTEAVKANPIYWPVEGWSERCTAKRTPLGQTWGFAAEH